MRNNDFAVMRQPPHNKFFLYAALAVIFWLLPTAPIFAGSCFWATACYNAALPLPGAIGPMTEAQCLAKPGVYYSDNNCTVPVSGSAATSPTDVRTVPAEPIEPITPRLQIPIPGLPKLSDVTVLTEDGRRVADIPFLAEYLAGLYRFLVGLAGLAATVMIIIGGIRWLLAAGDAGKIGAAKETITSAAVGLIIALGSYIVLFALNPELVAFKSLRIITVKQEVLEDDHSEEPGLTDTGGPIPTPTGELWRTDCAEKYPPPKKWKPCPVFNPTLSDRTRAASGRSVSVNLDYFGQVDCRSSGPRDLSKITKIVIHNGGSAKTNTQTWQCRAASAHYTINQDGVIYQHIGEERVSWHDGGRNSTSIGIELASAGTCGSSLASAAYENPDTRAMCAPTDAQISSLKNLIADIKSRTNVKFDENSIVGHCESGGTHVDPRAFDWARIGLNSAIKKAVNFPSCTTYKFYPPS